MKKEIEPKIKCEKCNNYEVSMCGTYENCHANKEGSEVIPRLTEWDKNIVMTGEKQTCKCFKKIELPEYMKKKKV